MKLIERWFRPVSMVARATGTHKKLVVALIADNLTRICLEEECAVVSVTPWNYKKVFAKYKPDLLLVESAWEGYLGAWKYRIASYPEHQDRTNADLASVVSMARDFQVPTVFWNKEDGVHFSRFIDSAKLFDHIFTVDQNCISKYRAMVNAGVSVNTLMFPVQSATHFFKGFNFKFNAANFVGSYSHHIHDRRRAWQDMFFNAATLSGMQVNVFDRNSARKSENYRYPEFPGLDVRAAVPHNLTAEIYRDFLVSLNVNTIEDSPSMYSRRLVEIIACGGIAVTNPNPAVDLYFKNYCHVVSGLEETVELLARLRQGPSSFDLDRAEAGAIYVRSEHTWEHRLNEISNVVAI